MLKILLISDNQLVARDQDANSLIFLSSLVSKLILSKGSIPDGGLILALKRGGTPEESITRVAVLPESSKMLADLILLSSSIFCHSKASSAFFHRSHSSSGNVMMNKLDIIILMRLLLDDCNGVNLLRFQPADLSVPVLVHVKDCVEKELLNVGLLMSLPFLASTTGHPPTVVPENPATPQIFLS